MQPIVSYEEAVSLGSEVVGGKGWNLGRLQRYGFRVPAGGILSADVYTHFIHASALQPIIAEIAEIQADALSEKRATDILATLRAALEAMEFPAEIEQAIQTFLDGTGLAHLSLAVRSSATTEDSAAFSFAGIHESFLHIPGTLQEVLQAIKGCYASLWTPRALAYRRHCGLADDAVACAVVICALVTGPNQEAPEVAGVAFSCDPLTGQQNRVTINAASGWGEAVVKGTLSPEVIAVVQSVDGEPLRIERANEQAPILGDTQAGVLAALVQRILWVLGDGQEHQDVEWACAGGHFWIVQARPVTHRPQVNFPAVVSQPAIWSNGNVKEVMPGLLTPLSWSILQPVVTTLLCAPCLAVDYSLPDGIEIMRRFSGRAYFNLTALQWGYYDALGVLPREFNQGIGGHQPEITVPTHHPLRGRAGLRRMRGRLQLLRTLGRNARTLPGAMQRVHGQLRMYVHQNLTDLSHSELYTRLQSLITCAKSFGLRFQFANMGGVWGDYLVQALERERPGQGLPLSSALMAGTHAVVSAEHAYQLYKVALIARDDALALAYLATSPRDSQGWLHLADDSPFRRAFASFLATFGHRGIYEFELANPRWDEEASYLLDCIQAFLAQEASIDPYAQARERRREAEAELARLPLHRRPLVSWLAWQARRTASHREAGKSTLVAILQPLRELVREIGLRMFSTHILEDREDIFFLAWPEIAAFLRGTWNGQGAKALVLDRKQQYQAKLKEEPADVLMYQPEGDSITLAPVNNIEDDIFEDRGGILQGLGASPGKASGYARLISHPQEGQRLQVGEILVAPSTDPGWTPLFLRASALIMETGGYLSHGAIVAREFGIPAVINVPGLLKAIEDGQYLTVDGNQGRVFPGEY